MFSEDYWRQWSDQEEKANYRIKNGKKEYLKKGYTHFDHRFWFPDKKDELKKILQDDLLVLKPTGRKEYWSFSPFLKVLVKTPRYRYQEVEEYFDLETKIRPICFASHLDSLIFGYYAFALTKKYEEYIHSNNFAESVLAYRSDLGISNVQFAREVFDKIKLRGPCTAIALDIKGYFDHIEHKTLKEKWLKVLNLEKLPEDQFRIYKALTRYSYVGKDAILKKFRPVKKRGDREPSILLELIPGKHDFEKFDLLRKERLVVTNDKPNKKGLFIGVPQGSAMSAMLSNIYLIDFDKMMYEKSQAENFIYRRYCDDILIVCDTERADELKKFAIEKIHDDYHQTIQDKKVETIDFNQNSRGELRAFKRKKGRAGPVITKAINEKRYYKPLQYLGFEFNGRDILIRSSSLSRYFIKMRARIVKTVSMAYGAKPRSNKIFKRQIFERYTHLGKRNFISYAFNASKNTYQTGSGATKRGANSPAIRRQISRHFSIILNTLAKKNQNRFDYKMKGKKSVVKKGL